ncbi:MAG: hypothetical protein ACT6FG_00150 [Methanosarcinaceae archaeon]
MATDPNLRAKLTAPSTLGSAVIYLQATRIDWGITGDVKPLGTADQHVNTFQISAPLTTIVVTGKCITDSLNTAFEYMDELRLAGLDWWAEAYESDSFAKFTWFNDAVMEHNVLIRKVDFTEREGETEDIAFVMELLADTR